MADDVEAIAKTVGSGERISTYRVPDDEMAIGSTLGSPKATIVVKATGAIEKFYAIDPGKTLFGTLVVHHWDAKTGVALSAVPGEFIIHPYHQERRFQLFNGVGVREDIFVLCGKPRHDSVDPPAAYYTVELRNETDREIALATYASLQLRGDTEHDVCATYVEPMRSFVVSNRSDGKTMRAFASSEPPNSHEVTRSFGKTSATRFPGPLSGQTLQDAYDPVGIFHFETTLAPGETRALAFTLIASVDGENAILSQLALLPTAREALRRTAQHFHAVLDRAVVVTPSRDVNRGVLWAKANMLRVELLAPTGWCLVNDPTRSNNSVGRDTAWFAFGSDYITPDFSRESLLWYAQHLEENGKVVEYYDVRSGKSEDYGLNINDNTPLLILALWHHYNTSGNREFLQRVYPAALRAGRCILAERNDRGLVWCTATGTADWGIIGWRNVIKNYRLSGASTEVNSECFAALQTLSHMARELEHHEESAEMRKHAEELRSAINAHLLDPDTGLYYLNIDLDGNPRTDVTSDLVFPVMFGVADEATSARIMARLSAPEFWSDAGIRTVPRNAIQYGPTHGYGLLGGVWVGVTFWYAFAAARFNPDYMGHALASSFQHYSGNPRRNNTVPGQFSEWLHGETLVNQGMMLSPWFPPRYLWAAIEGAAGLDLSGPSPSICPRLPADWSWLGVQRVPFRGKDLSWIAVRTPTLQVYMNMRMGETQDANVYDEDVSDRVYATGDSTVSMAFSARDRLAIFVGNSADSSGLAALQVHLNLEGAYAVREYNSARQAWIDWDVTSAQALLAGLPIELDQRGFVLLELRRQT